MTPSEVAAALDRLESLIPLWLSQHGADSEGFWQDLASTADEVVENVADPDQRRYFSARLDSILERHGIPSPAGAAH